MIELTEELIEQSKGEFGFTQPQDRIAHSVLGKNWQKRLKGRLVEETWWEKFCRMGKIGYPLNPPNKGAAKKLKRASRKKRKLRKVARKPGDEFYISEEWRQLRYRVLKNNEGKCMACGRSYKEHGVVIHVDHIKPRSKYPSLQLVYENLQLLCEDCNIGKSNKDETDWRAK